MTPHVRHDSPAFARVGIVTLQELRRLVDPQLPDDEREALSVKLRPDLDHLIEVARQRAWPL